MEDFEACAAVLRAVIAGHSPNGTIWAENAIDDLMGATPLPEKRKTLLDLQLIVMAHLNAATGSQRSLAETVNAYIEKQIQGLD